MKSVPMLAGVGLLIGLVFGTGVQLAIARRAPALPTPAVHDSTKEKAPDGEKNISTEVTDTAAALSARRDSIERDSLRRADSARVQGKSPSVAQSGAPVIEAPHVPVVGPRGGPMAILPGGAPMIGAVPVDTIPSTALPASKIGRIFASMPPKDAAKVLVQLEARDVARILGALSQRQAAAILSNFPPERAAEISRMALHPELSQPKPAPSATQKTTPTSGNSTPAVKKSATEKKE